jgi:hypothetical protein
MRFKCLKATLISLLLVCSCIGNIANAGLIDSTPTKASYTTLNGLDWLDWSLTTNMTNSIALANYKGWRLATAEEASDLMHLAFGSLTYNSFNQVQLSGSSYFPNYDLLESLFGRTGENISREIYSTLAQVSGFGLIGATKVSRSSSFLNVYKGYNLAIVSGDTAFSDYGIALVREVPEPTTLAIFALGIIGLASRRYKQQS